MAKIFTRRRVMKGGERWWRVEMSICLSNRLSVSYLCGRGEGWGAFIQTKRFLAGEKAFLTCYIKCDHLMFYNSCPSLLFEWHKPVFWIAEVYAEILECKLVTKPEWTVVGAPIAVCVLVACNAAEVAIAGTLPGKLQCHFIAEQVFYTVLID